MSLGVRPASENPEREFEELQEQMREVLPEPGPRKSERLRDVRRENQTRFERALRMRQRPTRVS